MKLSFKKRPIALAVAASFGAIGVASAPTAASAAAEGRYVAGDCRAVAYSSLSYLQSPARFTII